MESELKKQLNQLKVNQRNEARLPSKNADFSLLFDFRNSKKIDIDTYYELGYMGLLELSKSEDKLLGFIANVFSPFAKYYNRNMKTESEIKETDQSVESLIKILNPYFENPSCHKIIEFLIKIYQVNIFNSRVLLFSFLPFHESKVFVKLLQNINLDNDKNFSFMSQSAKNGTIILREQIITEISKNYEFFKEIVDFYTTNINEGYKFSSYNKFIFDLINKVVVYKEKTNENLIALVIKFINSLFIYISKRKVNYDENFSLIVSGVCDVLLCVLTKFEISNEYYRALINEYILTILPKLRVLSSIITKFAGSLIILFSIKNEIILSKEASKLLLSEYFLKELNELSMDYDISPLLLTIVYNLSCCNDESNDYESNIQVFPSILKTLCKYNIEGSKFVHICEKIIELLKINHTSSFKNAVLDIVRFIDEVKPEQMNLAMINLDKGRNREFLEKFKANLFETLVKTKLLMVKDTDMNCLIGLMNGLTHSNNSVVVTSIKHFDKLLEDGSNQYNEFLSKFNFILKNKLRSSNEKEVVLSEIFKMKNLGKLLHSNGELNKELKEFFIRNVIDQKIFLKNYSIDLFNLIEKAVFEHSVVENQDEENEILNMLVLLSCLGNNSTLNKVAEKNSYISKIIKFKLTASDYTDSFVSYISSNTNKKMNSKVFYENFSRLIEFSDNKNTLNLDYLYNISENLLLHYKENIEFLSEEFVESLNLLTDKLEKYSEILLTNDRFIEITIKTIPKLFDNFHVNKIRKNVLKIMFKLIKLAKNFENVFDSIKKVHFHNYDDLFFTYIVLQLVISSPSERLSGLVLTYIKNNMKDSIEYSLILSLISFLQSESHTKENKKIVLSILGEIQSISKVRFNNINLLFNHTKTKNNVKELSYNETFKLVKTIVDSSKEILFDKKYINDVVLTSNIQMETLKNFLEITEGFNTYTDYELFSLLANIFYPYKINNFSIVDLDKYLSSIVSHLPHVKMDVNFYNYLSKIIDTGVLNLTQITDEDERLIKNDEFDFLSNLVNNILLNINNNCGVTKETVSKIIKSFENYDIQSLFKKNKGKNCFELLYKILKISFNFGVNILIYDFEIDYKTILKTFTTKFEKKELNLQQDEMILSNFISLLNNHKSFKTEFLTQLVILLTFVQENDVNHTSYFALKLHILLAINNLLTEFNKRKNEAKYNNLNVNYEKENITKIKNFIFANISDLLKKCEQVEDSETNLFNYLNVLNLSFEIVVRFSFSPLDKKKNKNICIEILSETFKKMDEIRLNIINNKETLHVSDKFISDVNYLLIKSVNSMIFLVLTSSKADKNTESAQLFISEFVKYSLLYFYDNIILKDIFDCIISTIKGSSKDIFDQLISCFITNVVYFNYLYSKRETVVEKDQLYANYQINYIVNLINELNAETKITLILLLINKNKASSLSMKFFIFNFLEFVVLKNNLVKDLYVISKKEASLTTKQNSVNEKTIVSIINVCFELYLHMKQIKSEITIETKELYLYYKQLVSFEEMLLICLTETNIIFYLLPYLLKFDLKTISMPCLNYLLKKSFEALISISNEELNKLNLTLTVNSLLELLRNFTKLNTTDNSKEENIPQSIFSILTKIVKKEYYEVLTKNFDVFSQFYKRNNIVVRMSCLVFITKLFHIFDENLLGEFNSFIEEFLNSLSIEKNNQQNEINESYIECLIILSDKVGDYFSPFIEKLLKNAYSLVKESNLAKLQTIFKNVSEKVMFDSNYHAISTTLSLALEGNESQLRTKLVFTYLKNTLEKSNKLVIESLLIDITKLFIKALELNKEKNNIPVILDSFSVFIRKMNPRQLEKSLEKILSYSFKVVKESEIGFNYENCIIGYLLLNRILENAAQLFVSHFKKYVNYSNDILTSIYSIYSHGNKSVDDNKKKSRQFFDEKADYHNENSYISLQALILQNYKLNFKLDKDIIMNDEIEEVIQPVCNQLKLYTIEESSYLKIFEENIVNCIVEMMRSIKNDDIFKRFNDSILELLREDHYVIKLLSLRTIKYLFLKMHEKYITLISDTVPYVMELLEDLNEKVSNEAGETIKTIEKLTGQNINDYIENNI